VSYTYPLDEDYSPSDEEDEPLDETFFEAEDDSFFSKYYDQGVIDLTGDEEVIDLTGN
jgi:hypothetical protein